MLAGPVELRLVHGIVVLSRVCGIAGLPLKPFQAESVAFLYSTGLRYLPAPPHPPIQRPWPEPRPGPARGRCCQLTVATQQDGRWTTAIVEPTWPVPGPLTAGRLAGSAVRNRFRRSCRTLASTSPLRSLWRMEHDHARSAMKRRWISLYVRQELSRIPDQLCTGALGKPLFPGSWRIEVSSN